MMFSFLRYFEPERVETRVAQCKTQLHRRPFMVGYVPILPRYRGVGLVPQEWRRSCHYCTLVYHFDDELAIRCIDVDEQLGAGHGEFPREHRPSRPRVQ